MNERNNKTNNCLEYAACGWFIINQNIISIFNVFFFWYQTNLCMNVEAGQWLDCGPTPKGWS